MREPNLRRVSRDREMDDSPSMVVKYNHGMMEINYNRGIKHPKRSGRDDEHVDPDDDCHRVPQKLRQVGEGPFRAPRQIPSNF